MAMQALRVLTYNVKMLPGPFGNGSKDLARAKRICEVISGTKPGWDVVCLQEVFDEEARKVFAAGLKKKLPHQVTRMSDGDLFQEDSGLFFACKYPIVGKGFREFNRSADSDGLADKGIFGARLAVGAGHVLVFNTHLQSSRDRDAVRRSQLAEIRHVVRKAIKRVKGVVPKAVLLCGDLNVTAEDLDGKATAEYLHMLALLGSPRDLFRDMHAPAANPGFTWDGSRNSMIAKHDPDKQRLDYVFAWDREPELHDNDAPGPVGVVSTDAVAVMPFETARARACLSDHFAVDARISFAV